MGAHQNIRKILASSAAFVIGLQPTLTYALPVGGQVSAGQASIGSSGLETTINQASPRAVINWTGFDANPGETVRFLQPSASAIALNRISGGPTSFEGSLLANGNVWLINPNGMLFGGNASINVGGFLATTSAITDSDFMAGNYRFTPGANPNASITNNGSITVAQAGLAAFVAPSVVNNGTITARLGRIALASGDSFALDLFGDGLINLQASPALSSQLIANHGVIAADGGSVVLTTAQAQNIVDSLINMDGAIEADALGAQAGSVRLYGSDTTSLSGRVSALGGSVETSGGTLSVSGTVIAKDWLLDPNNVTIQAAGPDTNVTGSPNFTTNNDSAIVTTGSIETALNNGTNVTVQTGSAGTNSQAGDIEVASNITKSAGGDASLTLEAYRNITLDSGVQISSSSGKLNVTLDADAQSNHSGSIYLANGSGIISNGGNITLGGGSNPLIDSAYGNNSSAPDGTSLAGGIYINGATLNAGGGNISITGTSAAPNSSYGAGVDIEDNSLLETGGTGTITVTGSGSTSPSSVSEDAGVIIYGSTLTTGAGNIAITGTGGNAAYTGSYVYNGTTYYYQEGWNPGIDLESSWSPGISSLLSTTSGNIVLHGTGGIGANGDSEGVAIYGGSSNTVSLQTNSGAISITGSSNRSTSFNGGWNAGVDIEGGYNWSNNTSLPVSISSRSGPITITGQGGTSTASDNNAGVYLWADNITSGSAPLTITGTGGSSPGGYDVGVWVDGYNQITSATGDIRITGQGGTAGPYEAGVLFDYQNNTVQSTGTGASAANITITGTAGNGTGDAGYGFGNVGVGLFHGAAIWSLDGNISITGTGAGSGSDNYGVYLGGNTQISSAGNGTIALTGSGAGAAAIQSDEVQDASASNSLTSTRSNITLLGDSMSLPSADTAISSGATVTLAPLSASTPVNVAGGNSGLAITADMLSAIAANGITIGSAGDTGAMNVGSYAWNSNVTFLNGGVTTLSGVTSTGAGESITIAAGGSLINTAGAGALVPGAGGRWLVYSTNPSDDTPDGLTSGFLRYSCTYGGACPSFSATGNGSTAIAQCSPSLPMPCLPLPTPNSRQVLPVMGTALPAILAPTRWRMSSPARSTAARDMCAAANREPTPLIMRTARWSHRLATASPTKAIRRG